MLNSHFNYCILLIQRGSNVTQDVTDEYPRHIEYQWHMEAREKRRLEGQESEENVDMEEDCDELGRDKKKKKAHRKLFTQQVKNNFYDSEDNYDSEDDSEDSEDMANNRAD
jgi:hypothetical protein